VQKALRSPLVRGEASAINQQVFVRGVLTGFDPAGNCAVTGPDGALASREASELLPANKSDDAPGKHMHPRPNTLDLI